MYMKDNLGNSISDDAEFDDLDDFDYVDQFISKDDEGAESTYADDDYDDLDDLYVEEEETDLEEIDELEDMDEDHEEEDEVNATDDDISDMDEELEAKFICEECGHKWVDFVSETDEENDLFEVNCPLCGSQNVTMER
jgi:rubrerythrin